MSFNKENREEFINISSDFIDWMVEKLSSNNETFHSWVSSGNWRIGLNRGLEWECSSIFNAYTQYYWGTHNPITNERISNYTDTENLLTELGAELTAKLDPDNCEGIGDTCLNILKWGGVSRYENIATVMRNDLLDDNTRAVYLTECKNYLNGINSLNGQNVEINVNGDNHTLQLDSGTTKIFSLIADNYIMYDSRVGAALALLVRKWANEKSQEIPDVLKFSWQGNQNRNPNIYDNCKKTDAFPKFKKNKSRIPYNIAANWLCTEILKRGETEYPNSCFYQLEEGKRLRAIEAALFMIGYKVNKCEYTVDKNTNTVTTETISDQLNDWIMGSTITGSTFQWCFNDDKLHIITGKQTTPGISLSATEITELFKFITSKDFVILGNSKTDKPTGIDFERSVGWNHLHGNNKSQIYASHLMGILITAEIVNSKKNGRRTEFTMPNKNSTYTDLYNYYEDTVEST